MLIFAEGFYILLLVARGARISHLPHSRGTAIENSRKTAETVETALLSQPRSYQGSISAPVARILPRFFFSPASLVRPKATFLTFCEKVGAESSESHWGPLECAPSCSPQEAATWLVRARLDKGEGLVRLFALN